MKAHASFITLLLSSMLLLAACTSTPPPATTPEGLALVKNSKVNLLYVRPGVDLGGYDQFVLVEPQIAFRKNWQSDKNATQLRTTLSDKDVAEIIATGKTLLIEEFDAELKKAGYNVVEKTGPKTLAIKASILDLDIAVPDTGDDPWTKTYTDGSGEATLVLELFDSVTGQVLVRAFDKKSNQGDDFSWRIEKNRQTNIQNARAALGSWAEMLVEGLNRVKSAK